MKEIKLILDQDVLDRYNEYYFSKHPRATKIPIEKPIHPSINVWAILQRIQMNALKQKHKDFICWWIKDMKLNDMHLDNFEVEYDIYHPTKRRADPDNYTAKFWHDGFVESGFWVDDDRDHLHSMTIRCHVDKEHPRTEICIKILN